MKNVVLDETAPGGMIKAAPAPGRAGFVIATVPPELPTEESAESLRKTLETVAGFPALSVRLAWRVCSPSGSGVAAVSVACPGLTVKAHVTSAPSSVTFRVPRATPERASE